MSTKVFIDDQSAVPYALSIGANISDLGRPWRVIMHSVCTLENWPDLACMAKQHASRVFVQHWQKSRPERL